MKVALLWICWVFFLTVALIVIQLERRNTGHQKVIMVMMQNCENLGEGIIRQLRLWGARMEGGVSILIVVDSSRDRTKEIVKRMARIYPEIVVVYRNNGSQCNACYVKNSLAHLLLALDFREPRVFYGLIGSVLSRRELHNLLN